MKPNFANKFELAAFFGFEPKSIFDFRALDTAWEYYSTDYRGCGCMGSIREVLSRTSGSHKTDMAMDEKHNDTAFKMASLASGNIRYEPLQSKINGGQIADAKQNQKTGEIVVTATIPEDYVVYAMWVCNSNTSGKLRAVEPKIFRKKFFIEKLTECGAVKVSRYALSHGVGFDGKGLVKGYQIQPTQGAWYEFLVNYSLSYDRNRVYTIADFESAENI